MKVLFVCSGNKGISPIVKAQADSLIKQGIGIDIFPVVGKGLRGYYKNIPILRVHLIKSNSQIVHAHYSLCGIVASLAMGSPIITSLMGSDVMQSWAALQVTKLFARFVWKATIVKSPEMKTKLMEKHAIVLPNGVNTDIFEPLDKKQCRELIGWDDSKKKILFAANPNRSEKNFLLAKRAVEELKHADCELQVVYNVHHSDLPRYLNASDVVLLTSTWEGSPNIIKEAMACNCRIVSTPVGDVSTLLNGVDGSWVVEANANMIALALTEALNFKGSCNGRDRIKALELDSVSIANKLINLYKELSE